METTNTETADIPVVKLTKKGKPDKRAVTSRENINKAQSKVNVTVLGTVSLYWELV